MALYTAPTRARTLHGAVCCARKRFNAWHRSSARHHALDRAQARASAVRRSMVLLPALGRVRPRHNVCCRTHPRHNAFNRAMTLSPACNRSRPRPSAAGISITRAPAFTRSTRVPPVPKVRATIPAQFGPTSAHWGEPPALIALVETHSSNRMGQVTARSHCEPPDLWLIPAARSSRLEPRCRRAAIFPSYSMNAFACTLTHVDALGSVIPLGSAPERC